MCKESGNGKGFQPFVWLGIAAAAVLVLWAMSPYLARAWASLPGTAGDTGTTAIADQFGVTSSLFTALAFAALLVTIYQQQRGLAQQREELRSQRDELALQREELKRSVEEMERSADAQAAQVRINTLSAILASLPVLIQEEENRLVGLSERGVDDTFSLSFLRSCDLAGLQTAEGILAQAVASTHEYMEPLRAEIAELTQEMQRAKPNNQPGTGGAGPPPTDVPPAAQSRPLAMVRAELEDKQKAMMEAARRNCSNERTLPCLRRFIALRQELAATYEQMKAFQTWEGRKTGGSGQAAESDT